MGNLAGRRSSCRSLLATPGLLSLSLLACTGRVTPVGGLIDLCQNGDGSFKASGSICRKAVGVCDVEETCTGASAECPDDALRNAGLVCRASAGPCDLTELCTGREADCPEDSFLPETTVCRPSADGCDVEETCTGTSAACPDDAFLPSTTVCRNATGACDAEERCTGSSPACPADAFLSVTVTCRASAGPCDVEESCSGNSPTCPADGFLSASTRCRASAGICDVEESCSGSSPTCPADAFLTASSVCRASAGACDVEERCTGSAATCPGDVFLSSSTVCRPAADVCDVEELCSGASASCPGDAFLSSSSACRPSAGACDAVESCTGHSAACPADVFLPASAVCRASAGPCDLEESCSGQSATCPGDGFLSSSAVCRPSACGCDLAESCTGAAALCPPDGFVAAGSVCSENGGNACDGAGSCVVCANLCQLQTQCAGAATTSISGTVFMPNGTDPLPNTLVYVPNGPVQPLSSGVQSCQPCRALVSGSPLVSAVTDYAGHFTLTNMPVGTHIPLVIQNGKWRRQFDLPSVAACVDTVVAQQLRMPANQGEGDLPKIALVTGGFSALECVLLKMGIAAQEFGNGSPVNTQRVQFYLADGNPGAHYDSNTPIETALWGTQASVNQYDLVFFGCQGSRYPRTNSAKQTLIAYANAGGQVIFNHYAFEWMYSVQPFSGTAYWDVDQPKVFASDPQPAFIDTSFPKGQMLARWLALTDPSGVPGQVPLDLLYTDFDGVVAPSQLWMSLHDSLHPNPVPMQYTFETPVGSAPSQQCGRVMFNEYHSMESFPSETLFPSACDNSSLRPDERLMEFMIFDQGSCR